MVLHDAAGRAARDRFRAILRTAVTTVAGMLPLLFETSLQAQVLVPMLTSIAFGMMSSTVLLLPAAHSIMEDVGFTEIDEKPPQPPDAGPPAAA